MFAATTVKTDNNPLIYLIEEDVLKKVTTSPHIAFIIDKDATVQLGNKAFCVWLQTEHTEAAWRAINIANHLNLPVSNAQAHPYGGKPAQNKTHITLQNICFQYEPDVKSSVVSVQTISRQGHQMITVKPIEEWEFLVHRLHRLIAEEDFVHAHRSVYEQLTAREREILELICDGLNSVEIAEKLFVSHHTVSQHRKKLYKKLNATTILDLFKYGRSFSGV